MSEDLGHVCEGSFSCLNKKTGIWNDLKMLKARISSHQVDEVVVLVEKVGRDRAEVEVNRAWAEVMDALRASSRWQSSPQMKAEMTTLWNHSKPSSMRITLPQPTV